MSLIFDNFCSDYNFDKKEEEEQDIGNCKEDFIPLKILYKDKDVYYQYLKVKSKKNNKIYLMKILKKRQGEQNSEGKHSKVEILVLKELKHKNIIKYYTDFYDSENYYLLLENTNFRNLNDFYLTYRNLGINIKEEIIWKILHQCLDVLVYIHNEGIIHREIEPKNILIDENYNIKLINFNKCAAMDKSCAKLYANNDRIVQKLIVNAGTKISNEYSAPEMQKDDFYCAKIDVFSLGEVLNLLIETGIKTNQNNFNYSNELKDIISRMRKESERRPTSDEIYDVFIKYYGNKYIKYSSIFSIFTCFFNFKSIRNYFNQNYQNENDNKITKYFVYFLFDYLKNYSEANFDENIISFKLDNLKDVCDNDFEKEIDPISFLKYLLSNLNKELNEKKGNQYKRKIYQKKTIKEEKYYNVIKPFNELFSSVITKNFVGLLKLKRICKKCQSNNYFFSHFYYLSFNMKNLSKNNSILKFEEVFESLIKDKKVKTIFCKSCKEETAHDERVAIFEAPKNLIIVFDQIEFGKKIYFPEKLTLNEKYVEILTSKKMIYDYYLCSILCYHKDDNDNKLVYISFTINDPDYNNPDMNVDIYNYNYIINHYNIIGLFYDRDIKEVNRLYKINACKQVRNVIEKKNNEIINSTHFNNMNFGFFKINNEQKNNSIRMSNLINNIYNKNDNIQNNNDIINHQNPSLNNKISNYIINNNSYNNNNNNDYNNYNNNNNNYNNYNNYNNNYNRNNNYNCNNNSLINNANNNNNSLNFSINNNNDINQISNNNINNYNGERNNNKSNNIGLQSGPIGGIINLPGNQNQYFCKDNRYNINNNNRNSLNIFPLNNYNNNTYYNNNNSY